MSTAAANVLQIKVSLDGLKPPIWRRLRLAADTDLGELHHVIQIAMGWEDAHLHVFMAAGQEYGDTEFAADEDMIEEITITIGSLLSETGHAIAYEYDFGDGWAHTVKLEKILDPGPAGEVPKCTDGARACPPEDVGGLPGYVAFLNVFEDPSHPEHEEVVEWAGEDFDPAAFDVDQVNAMLADGS